MAESMVERVAKAICRQANLDDGYADNATLQASIDGGMWRNHTGQACAAIEAMREPTPQMCEAGEDEIADIQRGEIRLGVRCGCPDCDERARALVAKPYTTMLDAALAETKEWPHGR